MTGITYGYARVSSQEQNTARQLSAIRAFGVAEKNIIVEKQSGKNFQRPLYLALVRRLRSGDTLVVKSIDRLGRNYAEILEQWAFITKERKSAIVVLQLLSYVAQTERENIRQRQAEGIAEAQARGVRFGPERKALPEEFTVLAERWQRGEVSYRKAAGRLGVSYQTFLRRAKEYINT